MKVLDAVSEGGQTWMHSIRMQAQILKIAIKISVGIGILSFILMTSFSVNQSIFIASYYHFKSELLAPFFDTMTVNSNNWKQVSGHNASRDSIEIRIDTVNRMTVPHWNYLKMVSAKKIKTAYLISIISLFSMIVMFILKGSKSKKKEHISGRKIVSVWYLALKLKFLRKASSIKIGKLPLIKGTETQHILLTGGTGSGKTNCMFHLLSQIRVSKKKAVIVDTTGTFVDKFFDPSKDILLSPEDPRSKKWTPWVECEDDFDYDDMAESFIPKSHSDNENYWRISAKNLFASILRKNFMTKKNSSVTDWILYKDLVALCNYLVSTRAASVMSMNSEKTASSVRSVAASYLTCLERLEDTDDPFSIKDWIKQENCDSWLFIACKPQHRTTFVPLISAWLSTAIRKLMSLEIDINRRVWFVVDELPSLNRMKDIEYFVAEGRKFGGCGIFSIQSPAQIESIYGDRQAKTIFGNCATKIVFSEQEPEIAERISKIFGEREFREYHQGISYGAHESRDAVNISSQEKKVPLITSSDIQSLKKNTAYVKLPENYPITKIKMRIFKKENRSKLLFINHAVLRQNT